MRLRPTVRVLLLDPLDRLLLFASPTLSDPDRTVWFATGGGIEPGESPREAAVREVREETGVDGVVLGPHVWSRRHVMHAPGGDIDLREAFFLARVQPFDVDTSGFTAQESALVTAWRWWTLAELGTTTDLLAPRALPHLLRDLLENGPPAAPLAVGV